MPVTARIAAEHVDLARRRVARWGERDLPTGGDTGVKGVGD